MKRCWILPVLMLGAVSLFVPFFVERHMLVFAPFVLALMARGLVLLASRRSGGLALARAAVLSAVLLLVLGLGARASVQRAGVPVGYGELAAQMLPRLQPGDRIVVQHHFFMSPMFYYLRGRFGSLVEFGAEERWTPAPGARLWVVRFESRELPPRQAALLAERECVERLVVREVAALLYVAKPTAPAR